MIGGILPKDLDGSPWRGSPPVSWPAIIVWGLRGNASPCTFLFVRLPPLTAPLFPTPPSVLALR
jgi:hypothetical protein